MLLFFTIAEPASARVKEWWNARHKDRLRSLALPDLIIEVTRSSSDARAHYVLAHRYLALGEFHAANDELRRLISLSPTAGAYRDWGTVLATMGRESDALHAFKLSIKIDPYVWQTYRQRCLLRLRREENRMAARDLERALELNPGEASLYLLAGRGYLAGRMEEKAMGALSRYLEQRPGDAEGYALLGSAHLTFGRLAEAERALEKALSLDDHNTLARRSMARVCLRRPQVAVNYDRAIAHLRKAAELEPNDGEAHRELGQALLQGDRVQEAIAPLERAVALSPLDYRAYYSLASAYDRSGERNLGKRFFFKEKELRQYHEALTRLRTVLEAKPGDVRSRMELARWHRRVGELQQAAQEYEVILHSPGSADRETATKELQEIREALSTAPRA